MCYKDEAEGGKEMAKDKIPAGLSGFQRRAKSRNVCYEWRAVSIIPIS